MDWKSFFDRLGMNGTRWQWRIMRWQRNLKNVATGRPVATSTFSVTNTLIIVNLIMFSLLVLQGVANGRGMRVFLAPDTNLLIHVGAQFWVRVIYHHEWWRCITYAYTHAGLIHLGFNMVVLYQVGTHIESEIGKSRFFVLYTLTALTATGLGYLWHFDTPVVGASGSLFGVIGFSVAYFHRQGTSYSLSQRDFMFRWAVIAFVFGLLVGADNAGHLGGAIGGAILGLILPQGVRGRQSTRLLFNGLAGLCLVATVWSFYDLFMSWF